jgi:hypothetical protein
MYLLLLPFSAAAEIDTNLYPREVISHHAFLPLAGEKWVQPLASDSMKIWENILWGVAGASVVYATVEGSLAKEELGAAISTGDFDDYAAAEEAYEQHRTRRIMGLRI